MMKQDIEGFLGTHDIDALLVCLDSRKDAWLIRDIKSNRGYLDEAAALGLKISYEGDARSGCSAFSFHQEAPQDSFFKDITHRIDCGFKLADSVMACDNVWTSMTTSLHAIARAFRNARAPGELQDIYAQLQMHGILLNAYPPSIDDLHGIIPAYGIRAPGELFAGCTRYFPTLESASNSMRELLLKFCPSPGMHPDQDNM